MNSRNRPGYWHAPQSHPNSNPNPATIAGQNFGHPLYPYGPSYGYPGWGYYPQPPSYWPGQVNQGQVQTSAGTPMMPPNADPYQSNLEGDKHTELWESPQSPQSPWIRAYEKHEQDEK